MSEQDFNKMFTPLLDQWYRFSLSIIGNKEEAEDVVQETLVKLWKRKNNIITIINIKAYSLQTVKNLSFDKIKKRKDLILFDNEDYIVNHNNLEDEIIAKDEITFVIKLISKLTNRQKEIFTLKDIEGFSYKEIEEITNLDISNIRATLSMARKRIKELYNKTITSER